VIPPEVWFEMEFLWAMLMFGAVIEALDAEVFAEYVFEFGTCVVTYLSTEEVWLWDTEDSGKTRI
jgi:hypothetical protein